MESLTQVFWKLYWGISSPLPFLVFLFCLRFRGCFGETVVLMIWCHLVHHISCTAFAQLACSIDRVADLRHNAISTLPSWSRVPGLIPLPLTFGSQYPPGLEKIRQPLAKRQYPKMGVRKKNMAAESVFTAICCPFWLI